MLNTTLCYVTQGDQVLMLHRVKKKNDINRDKWIGIGGGSIYCQMLPYCDKAIITKVHVTPESDTFFPNLDEDPAWELTEVLQSGEENGIAYEMCVYTRKGTA